MKLNSLKDDPMFSIETFHNEGGESLDEVSMWFRTGSSEVRGSGSIKRNVSSVDEHWHADDINDDKESKFMKQIVE